MSTELDDESYPEIYEDRGPRFDVPTVKDVKDLTESGAIFHQTPLHLLHAYNHHIRNKEAVLHPWQISWHRDYAMAKEKDKVLRMSLVACNGAGKSSLIIAPDAFWSCMTFRDARAVITSASGRQLDRQTGAAIVRLAQAINKEHQRELWKINYRFLTYRPTGATCELYATDTEGKAEGYHAHVPHGEFALIGDEAKSIPEKIFQAHDRCNDKTRYILVSSPGEAAGTFYYSAMSDSYIRYKIRFNLCPHISRDEYEEACKKHGEDSPFVRNSYNADFVSIGEETFILLDQLRPAYLQSDDIMWHSRHVKNGGLDIGLGAAETVFTYAEGNRVISQICWVESDAVKQVRRIKNIIEGFGIDPARVKADDGVAGSSILSMLANDGYRLSLRRNEASAPNLDQYLNWGAQMWQMVCRMLMNREIILSDVIKARIHNDHLDKLVTQITSRKYLVRAGKLRLQSKDELKKKDMPSPDRADSLILCFSDYTSPLRLKMETEEERLQREIRRVVPAIPTTGDPTQDFINRYREHEMYKDTSPFVQRKRNASRKRRRLF